MTEEDVKHTLYVNNLNEKIPLNQMKKTLQLLFSEYGQIIDIQLKRNIKMRGQAFIIFENINDATEAKKQLQNISLFKKNLRINFAKNESDLINQKDPNFEAPKRKKYILKDYWNSDLFKKHLLNKLEKKNFNKKENQNIDNIVTNETKDEINNILFLKDIPKYVDRKQLYDMIYDYPGFFELRFIKPRQCAFIEFENETQAVLALKSIKLKKFNEGEDIDINYSKKG